MTTQHSAGQASGATDARMNPKPVTPGEAKALWHMMEKPSSRKVADWFTAAGRPVSYETICRWRRAGWPGSSVADFMKGAAAALANIMRVAPALTGDIRAALADVIGPKASAKESQTTCAPPDVRSNADRAEEALLTALACATAVWKSIRDIATAGPSARAAGDADEGPALLLKDPDSFAALMLNATTAIDTAVEGLRELAKLRAEQSVSVLGPMGLKPSRH